MKLIIAIVVLGLFGTALPVEAVAQSDARIRGAKYCTAYIPTYERKYGIPSHLLSAISSHESGRYHKKLKIMLPWPWTINVEGKGYYFDTKAQAVAAVRKHQAAGKRSIDIGCMQVNLIHHSKAFSSLEKAFDPKHNVEYAASFLRRLYESEKSWRKAAAAYHSKTPSKGSKYVARIFKAWETIVNRLRLSSQQTISKADAKFDGRDMIPNGAGAKGKAVKLSRSGEKAAKPAQPKHTPVKMKIIEVSDTSQRAKNDIIIIKPDVSQASVDKAYKNQPSITRVDENQPASNDKPMSIVRLDKKVDEFGVKVASAEKPAPKKTGPRFIFTD